MTASDSLKFRFATDGAGNYGYLKADDSFVPFKSGGGVSGKIWSIYCDDGGYQRLANPYTGVIELVGRPNAAPISPYIYEDFEIILTEGGSSGALGMTFNKPVLFARADNTYAIPVEVPAGTKIHPADAWRGAGGSFIILEDDPYGYIPGSWYILKDSYDASGATVQAMYLGKYGSIGTFITNGMWADYWPEGIYVLTLPSSCSWGSVASKVQNVYLPRANADASPTTSVSLSSLFVFNGSSWVNAYTSNILSVLTLASNRYSSFGGNYSGAWLGTPRDSSYAWNINNASQIEYSQARRFKLTITPCFNLDLSQVTRTGNTIS